MTPEERAREAVYGWMAATHGTKLVPMFGALPTGPPLGDVVMEQVRLAIAEEREACAQLADSMRPASTGAMVSFDIGAAIRTRGGVNAPA